MSSWFSYIRNSIIREEEPAPQDADPSMRASTSASTSTSEQEEEQLRMPTAATVPSLSQEQREHIRDVLRRAERSGRGARVVVDSRQLRQGHPGRSAVFTAPQEPEGIDEGEGQQPEMVQMDSLPEDVEITVGPFSYCSYASSELMSEDSELADRGYISRDTTELTADQPETLEQPEGLSIAHRMQKLSRKIDKWLKSLDKEDVELSESEDISTEEIRANSVEIKRNETLGNIPPIEEAAETFESPTLQAQLPKSNSALFSYLDTLSHCICISAMERGATLEAEKILQFVEQLVVEAIQFAIRTVQKTMLEFLAEELANECLREALEELERFFKFPVEEPEINDVCYTIFIDEQPRWPISKTIEGTDSSHTYGADTQLSSLDSEVKFAANSATSGAAMTHSEVSIEVKQIQLKMSENNKEENKEIDQKHEEEAVAERLSKSPASSSTSGADEVELSEEDALSRSEKASSLEAEAAAVEAEVIASSSSNTSEADSHPMSMEEAVVESEEVKVSADLNPTSSEPIELTREELQHVERIQRLARKRFQTKARIQLEAPEIRITNPSPCFGEKLEDAAASSSGQTSEADSKPLSPEEKEENNDSTFSAKEPMNMELTEEELKHIQMVERLAEESFHSPSMLEAKEKSIQQFDLTEEELNHIARIQQMAEESSSFEAMQKEEPEVSTAIPAKSPSISSSLISSADSEAASIELHEDIESSQVQETLEMPEVKIQLGPPEIQITNPSPCFGEKLEDAAASSSGQTSEADSKPLSPEDEKESMNVELTEEELKHIQMIERMTEESSFEAIQKEGREVSAEIPAKSPYNSSSLTSSADSEAPAFGEDEQQQKEEEKPELTEQHEHAEWMQILAEQKQFDKKLVHSRKEVEAVQPNEEEEEDSSETSAADSQPCSMGEEAASLVEDEQQKEETNHQKADSTFYGQKEQKCLEKQENTQKMPIKPPARPPPPIRPPTLPRRFTPEKMQEIVEEEEEASSGQTSTGNSMSSSVEDGKRVPAVYKVYPLPITVDSMELSKEEQERIERIKRLAELSFDATPSPFENGIPEIKIEAPEEPALTQEELDEYFLPSEEIAKEEEKANIEENFPIQAEIPEIDKKHEDEAFAEKFSKSSASSSTSGADAAELTEEVTLSHSDKANSLEDEAAAVDAEVSAASSSSTSEADSHPMSMEEEAPHATSLNGKLEEASFNEIQQRQSRLEKEQDKVSNEQREHDEWMQILAEQKQFEEKLVESRKEVEAAQPSEEEDSIETSAADSQPFSFDEVEANQIEHPSTSIEAAQLTTEELEHIARVQKLAEESCFEAPLPTLPPVSQTQKEEIVEEPQNIFIQPIVIPPPPKRPPPLPPPRPPVFPVIPFKFAEIAAKPEKKMIPLEASVPEEKAASTQKEAGFSSQISGADLQPKYIEVMEAISVEHPSTAIETAAVEADMSAFPSNSTSEADSRPISIEEEAVMVESEEVGFMADAHPSLPNAAMNVNSAKDELTREELEHIERVKRLAEESFYEAPKPAVLPQQSESYEDTKIVENPTDFELTQEKLGHIAKIQQMAEESTLDAMQKEQVEVSTEIPAKLPSASSSLTSGADSEAAAIEDESKEGESVDLSEEMEHEETIQLQAEESFYHPTTLETPKAGILLEAPEIRITNPSPCFGERPEDAAASSSGKTSEADSEPVSPEEEVSSQPLPTSFEVENATESSGQTSEADSSPASMDEEAETFSIYNPIASIEEEIVQKEAEKPEELKLTQEELDHIARVLRQAEESSFCVTRPQFMEIEKKKEMQEKTDEAKDVSILNETVFEANASSGSTSSANSVEASLEEKESSEEEKKPIEFELTQEELEHIAKIQRMAEQSNAFEAEHEKVEPVKSLASSSTLTSSADSEATSIASNDGIEENVQKAGNEEEIEKIPENLESTQEELEHIANIQRMAENEAKPIWKEPESQYKAKTDQIIVEEAKQLEIDENLEAAHELSEEQEWLSILEEQRQFQEKLAQLGQQQLEEEEKRIETLPEATPQKASSPQREEQPVMLEIGFGMLEDEQHHHQLGWLYHPSRAPSPQPYRSFGREGVASSLKREGKVESDLEDEKVGKMASEERRSFASSASHSSEVKEVEDSQVEVEDGMENVEDDQVEVEEVQAELEEGRARVEDGLAVVEDDLAEIQEGQDRIEDGQAVVEEVQVEIEDGQVGVEDGKIELEDSQYNVEDDKLVAAVEERRSPASSASFESSHSSAGLEAVDYGQTQVEDGLTMPFCADLPVDSDEEDEAERKETEQVASIENLMEKSLGLMWPEQTGSWFDSAQVEAEKCFLIEKPQEARQDIWTNEKNILSAQKQVEAVAETYHYEEASPSTLTSSADSSAASLFEEKEADETQKGAEEVMVKEEERRQSSTSTSGADFEEEHSTPTSEADSQPSSMEEDQKIEDFSKVKEAVELTREELEHIERMQRMAEESIFEAPMLPVLPQQSQPIKAAEAVEKPMEFELTQEELEHIARIQRMAEQSSFEAKQKEKQAEISIGKSSSLTSSADSVAASIEEELQKDTENVEEEEKQEVLNEQLEHEEWLQILAEQRQFEENLVHSRKEVEAVQPNKEDSSQTSAADSQLCSMEEVEAHQIEIPSTSHEAAELTSEELENIERVQQLAEESLKIAAPTRPPPPRPSLPEIQKPAELQAVFDFIQLPPLCLANSEPIPIATEGIGEEIVLPMPEAAIEKVDMIQHAPVQLQHSQIISIPVQAFAEEIPQKQLQMPVEANAPKIPPIPPRRPPLPVRVQTFEEESSSLISETLIQPNFMEKAEKDKQAQKDAKVKTIEKLVKEDEETRNSTTTSEADFEKEHSSPTSEADTHPSSKEEDKIKASSKGTEQPVELTKEEMEHIERVQRMAEESFFGAPMLSFLSQQTQPEIVERPSILTESNMKLTKVQQKTTSSEATSGAETERSSIESVEEEEIYQPSSSPLLSDHEGDNDLKPIQAEIPEIGKKHKEEAVAEQFSKSSASNSTSGANDAELLEEYDLSRSEKMNSLDDEVAAIEAEVSASSSSSTSEADSRPMSMEAEEAILANEEAILAIVHPTLSKAVESDQILTKEELEHIEKIQRMAEENFFQTEKKIDVEAAVPVRTAQKIESAASSSSLTSSADSEAASFEAEPEEAETGPKTIKDLEPVELTREELEHIERVQRMAEENFFEAPMLPTLPQMSQPKIVEKPLEFELTQEELEHIAKIQKMAEESSFEAKQKEQTKISINIPAKSPSVSSSLTSSADSEAASFEEELKNEKEAKIELTQEELDHIEQINRMAAEMAAFDVEVPSQIEAEQPMVEEEQKQEVLAEQRQFEEKLVQSKKELEAVQPREGADSSETSAADSQPYSMEEEAEANQIELPSTSHEAAELTREELEHIERVQQLAEESNFQPQVEAVQPTTSQESSFSLTPLETPQNRRDRQHSLTTTVSYTNTMRGRRWLSVTDNSIDQSSKEEDLGIPAAPRKSSASSVKIVFTDEKLRRSFCESADQEDEAVLPVEEAGKVGAEDNEDLTKNLDFLLMLDFLAQRITEEIAEEAVKDIQTIEQIRANPRAMYFVEEKYATLLTGEERAASVSSEEENELEDEAQMENHQQEYAAQLQSFQVEPFHEEAQKDALSSSIGGLFTSLLGGRRRSSVERPRSALPFLFRAPPTPNMARKASGDANMLSGGGAPNPLLNLLRKSSGASDQLGIPEEGVDLPDEALAGLSEQERAHILRVVAESRQRLPSSNDASRSSSVMCHVPQAPPDLDGLDDAEKRHIESVMQKAAERKDSPFVIAPPFRRQPTEELEMEEEKEEADLQEEESEKIEEIVVKDEEVIEQRPIKISSSFGSLFSIKSMVTRVSEKISEFSGFTESDLDAAQNTSEMEAANEEIEATRKLEKFEQPSVEATQKMLETEEAAILPEAAKIGDELTEEELEHIRRVTEMAMRLEEEEAVMELPKLTIEQIPSSIFASAKQLATASAAPTMPSSITSRFSGGIQSLTDQTKKLKGKTTIFGDFAAKVRSKGEELLAKEETTMEVEDMQKLAEQPEIAANFDETHKKLEEEEVLPVLPEIAHSPSSPEFWKLQKAGEEDGQPIEQDLGSSTSSTSTDSSGLGESMPSTRDGQTDSQFFSSGSLSTLTEQVAEEAAMAQSPPLGGEVQESARRVVDEISWFKQELEKMNRALMEQDEGQSEAKDEVNPVEIVKKSIQYKEEAQTHQEEPTLTTPPNWEAVEEDDHLAISRPICPPSLAVLDASPKPQVFGGGWAERRGEVPPEEETMPTPLGGGHSEEIGKSRESAIARPPGIDWRFGPSQALAPGQSAQWAEWLGHGTEGGGEGPGIGSIGPSAAVPETTRPTSPPDECLQSAYPNGNGQSPNLNAAGRVEVEDAVQSVQQPASGRLIAGDRNLGDWEFGQERRRASESADVATGYIHSENWRDRAHSTAGVISDSEAPRGAANAPISGGTLLTGSATDSDFAPPSSSSTTNPPSPKPTGFSNKMFGIGKQKQTPAGFGTFGSRFSKLATTTLKGAMQAGEQLSAKAASAVEKANQAMAEAAAVPKSASTLDTQLPPRPHSSLGLAGPSLAESTARTKSASLADISLPPGFEDLEEEEQMKIMAVMQCAQLDAEMAAEAGRIGAEMPKIQELPKPPPPITQPKTPEPMPAEEQPDLSGLSMEEQRQIMAVMRAAEEHEQIERERVASKVPTIIHELLDQDGQQIRRLSQDQFRLEQPVKRVMEEAEEEEGLGTGVIVEGSPSFLEDLSKYGQPTLPPAASIPTHPEESNKTEPEREEFEEDEELWMQPPRQEFTAPPEHWDNVPIPSSQRKLWTTVFTEEASSVQPQGMEIEIAGKKQPEEEELTEISAETVRGCWEMEGGGGKSAEEILRSVSGRKEAVSREEVASVARSIYTEGFGVQQQAQQKEQPEARIGHRLLEEQHSNNNSYEVEMEDPWSPSFTDKSMAEAVSEQQQQQRQIHAAPPTITVTAEKTPEPPDSEEEEEEIGGQRAEERQTSSSSEEEDDYPDQVIKAPTVSPATIAALQEEHEMEQQKIAAEVLQQIQAFGEAADDEFDVQWAKPKPAGVVQAKVPSMPERDSFFMEDAANVYSPSESQPQPTPIAQTEADLASDAKREAAEKQRTPTAAVLYRQRTNPFLMEEPGQDGGPEEEEEEEEGQDVVVRQEHLDAEDRDGGESEAERYYKGHFDHSLYFAHRPGPVYTIPESQDEENGAAPNREGIYHAERIERKPLHSDTMPTLISAEAMAASVRRRSNRTKESSAASTTSIEQPQQQRFWASSTITTAQTTSASTLPSEKVTFESEERLAEDQQQITPVRSAPPPPGGEKAATVGEQQSAESAAAAAKVHPLSAALHLQQQLQQLNQHKFVNKAKDIAQQEDLPPPSKHVPAVVGNGLVVGDTEEDLTQQSPRLKRSPAMNLTALGQTDTGHAELAESRLNTLEDAHPAGQHASLQTEQPLPFTASSLQLQTTSSSTYSSSSATATASAAITAHLLQQQHSAEMGRRRLPSLPTSALPYSSTAALTFGPAASTSFASTSGAAYTDVRGGVQAVQPPFDAFTSQLYRPTTSSSTGGVQAAQLPFDAFSSHYRTTSSSSTTKVSPIIYYTSAAPEKKDVAVNGSVPIETSESRVLFDAGLVATAQSVALSRAPAWSSRSAAITTTTMATPLRPYGSAEFQQLHQQRPPSVIPGATFRPAGRTSPASRPLSAAIPSYVSAMSTSLSPPRRTQLQQQPGRSRTLPAAERATHETLCQLMFKKELREALQKRKEALDTCEIEASHRQYVVDKWMRTGILPARLMRPAELDSVPSVVKCTLPAELVAGAKIVPQHFPWGKPVGRQRQEPGRYGIPCTSASSLPDYRDYRAVQPELHAAPHSRSIACQTDGIVPIATTTPYSRQLRDFHRGSNMPSTSLSAQLRAQPVQQRAARAWNSREASTQTALCAETQTDPTVEIDEPIGRQWPWPDTVGAGTDYYQPWEQQGLPPWQQPESRHGRRRRARLDRFLAAADTTSERGRKERQVREELERRRRELRFSMCDLREQELEAMAQYPTQWSGSLPRGLEFSQPTFPQHSLPPSTFVSPQTRRPFGYGSLPRDYERRMAAPGFSPVQQQQLRFGPASMPISPAAAAGSRSLQELECLSRFDRFHGGIGGRRMAAPDSMYYPSRSMNYLDRMGAMEADDLYRSPGRLQPGIVDDFGLPPEPDSQDLLLSEYANYLNSQFMLDQRQRELLDLERDQQQLQQQQFAAYGQPYGQNQFGYFPPMEAAAQMARGFQAVPAPYVPPVTPNYVPQQFAAPSYVSPQPGVYSRSEANYGARPPAQWTTDYGNLCWRQPGQTAYGQAAYGQSWPPTTLGRGFGQLGQIPPISAGAAAAQRLAQQRQPPQSILRRRAPPLRTTAGRDEVWPREMEWPRSTAATTATTGGNNPGNSNQVSKRSGEIKRLLLTRRYKHENIFKDLGIRVVGGKKLPNGDLGAFITSVDKNRAQQETLGELHEGDQVLEWNGILLSGKTYEEVERIMQAGTGEIELIVCCRRKGERHYDGDDEEEEDRGIANENGTSRDRRIADDWTAERRTTVTAPLTSKRSIAFADSTRNGGSKWHSPNEPPPVPAHGQSSNSISGEEEANSRSLPREKRATSGERTMTSSQSHEEQHPLANNLYGKGARTNGTFGYLQLALTYNQLQQVLHVRIISARALPGREHDGTAPNAFVKIYLMPGRKVSNKRRTKYVPHSINPVWDQQVEYPINADMLARHFLEFTVFDYDRDRRSDNQPLGQCVVSLSDPSIVFSGNPRWFALQPPHLAEPAVEDGIGQFGMANGTIMRGQQRTTRFREYNPATLDILNGYPAIA